MFFCHLGFGFVLVFGFRVLDFEKLPAVTFRVSFV